MFIHFLSIINQRPKKVVFIDDKKSHVEEVKNVLSRHGIEYIGFHYTAHQYVEKVYHPEVAEFQRKFLKTIMSNEAAHLLMQNGLE
jgi:predicted phosphatase